MKKFSLLTMISISLIAAIVSCKKDTDGSAETKAGNPQFSAISPTEGAGGTSVTVTGSGLGQMRTIVFDNNDVPATFTTTLNSENSIIFRVPDTAFGGDQNIIFTNSEGKTLSVPFKVIALPSVTEADNYDFTTGSQITLKGNNLEAVTNIVLTGAGTPVTIVSKTRKQIVVQMPATTLARTKLDVTNPTGTTTSTIELVNLAQNFVMYTDAFGPGAYNSGVQSWSWGSNITEVSDIVKTGTKALKVAYTNGGLSLFLGSDWGSPALNFTDFHVPYPTYLTFYARGIGAAANLTLRPDGGAGTFNASGSTTITVPKDEWAYFKIPASFITGKFARLNFTCEANTTVYFDDILWVK